MADKLSQIDKANGNSENGHNSRNEDNYDESTTCDETVEQNRQNLHRDSSFTSKPVETNNEEGTTHDNQKSPNNLESSFENLVLDMKQDERITGTAEPIETQTFWNKNYKDDELDNPVLINPLSLVQNYPTTKLTPTTSQGFSATDMLQPEMEKMPISLTETTIQCPLCQLYFPPYQIEIHASTCMDQ